jgi:hypothetical protein
LPVKLASNEAMVPFAILAAGVTAVKVKPSALGTPRESAGMTLSSQPAPAGAPLWVKMLTRVAGMLSSHGDNTSYAIFMAEILCLTNGRIFRSVFKAITAA